MNHSDGTQGQNTQRSSANNPNIDQIISDQELLNIKLKNANMGKKKASRSGQNNAGIGSNEVQNTN